jgi:hypothetical protein
VTPQWLLAAMTKSCVIWNRVAAGTDEYGNPAYDSVNVGASRCLLQPVSQSDLQLGRASFGTFNLYLPGEVAQLLEAFTRYEIEGVFYESEGPPAIYSQIYNTLLHHVEVNVSKGTA